MTSEQRIFVPQELAVIGFVHLGLNGLATVFANVVEINHIEEAVGIRVGPELLFNGHK